MARTALFYTDSDGFGGAELALLTLIDGLDRERWTPALAYHPTPGNAALADGARALGTQLHPSPPLPPGARTLPDVLRFAAWLRRLRPAVFHAHLPWQLSAKAGLAAAVAARVPCVVATLHLFVDVDADRSTRWQQRRLSRHVDRYLAVSEHVARHARDQLGWPSERIHVVRNGIALDRRPPRADAALRARLLGGAPGPLVLVAARLTEQKGHRYLLHAAAATAGARFVLAGSGPERAELERMAAALGVGDRVAFLGERRDVPALLAASDVVVLPSVNEGLPLIVLEAMAAARPVVATAVGGTGEAVVDGVTGLLVAPRDPGALATAIARLEADPAWARALGQAGRRRVEERFSARAMVGTVADGYEAVLSGATRRARPGGGPGRRPR